MIRKLIAALAILSLLLCVAVAVVWWRSNHGHVDQFTLGTPESTQTHFVSAFGRIMVETSERKGQAIQSTTRPYTFGDAIAFTLMLPSLWLATEIRRAVRRWFQRRRAGAK